MEAKRLRLVTVACAAAVATQFGLAQEPTRVFRESFDAAKPSAEWEVIHGDWAVEDGAYCQRDAAGHAYRYAVVAMPLGPALVTVEATATQKNEYGFASFGFVIKYVDASNWRIVRFGSYGGLSLLSMEDGEKKVHMLGKLTPKLGRTYQVALAWKQDRIAVFLDGGLKHVLRERWPETSGRLGLFTESPCRFDNLEAYAGDDAVRAYVSSVAGRLRTARIEAGVRLANGIFEEDFDVPERPPWRELNGDWRVARSRFEMISSGYGRRMALAPVCMIDGAIEGTATPTALSGQKTPRGVFGALVKWFDSANWVAVRYGEYGSVSALVCKDGEMKVKGICKFAAEVGRTYRFRVEAAGDLVTVYCDGERLGEVDAAFAGLVGRPGLYTEAPAAFDDVRVEGAQPLAKRKPKPITGTPRLELAFAAYRPAFKPGEVCLPSRGGVYLYVRNRGTGPAQLNKVLVDGVDADVLTQTVGWYRQRPVSLRPGEMGQILIRLSALPIEMGLDFFENPTARAMLPITVEPYGGEPLEVRVPIGTEADPFQINYIGFSPSLRRVYVYLQRNVPGAAKDGTPLHLSRILVNGRDLTAQTRFGAKEVSRDVVPVVVDLPKPLRQGEPVVVCVDTHEGAWAGHTVRAFPGEFQIQVTLLAKQTRPDAVKDIWRHGATCIGLCGASTDRLVEAKALGLTAFHYGRGGLGALRRFSQPKYPEISGFWLDEMDKLPLRYTFDQIHECELAYGEQGKFIPLQMINLCASRVPQAVEFYELGDAVCSAYGFRGGALGEGFGRVSSLPNREYRLTRLTFTPYFRDAEQPALVDYETKTMLGRDPKCRPCLDPKEERWMTYGCLIQGAKGIMHWNYGAGLRKPPGWFSKTHWALRASMGGALGKGNKPHGYEIPADMAAELQRVWDEIGRINLELRAIGPLVAVSDVSDLARVVAVTPELSPSGEAAAEAAALVSGLDSIVLIVLNHNIKTNWKATAERGIESYDPVDATVELRLPPWLEPKHTFRVRHDGVHKLTPEREAGRLTFRFERLEVSEAVVITERDGLMESMADRVAELRSRFAFLGDKR